MTNRTPDDPSYPIGRGKPPTATQFRKGQSGNPRGRPKKTAAEVDLTDAKINDFILGEAQRLITVTEGGKQVTIPAGRAVSRAMVSTAGQGRWQAQRGFLEMSMKAQAQRDKAQAELLASSYSLKFNLEQWRLRWVALGRDECDLDPHPSDIQINWSTGEVRLYLVLMQEERDARTTLLKMREEQQSILKRSWATIAEDGDDHFLRLGREIARERIRMINEYLAPRFREEPYPPPRRPLTPNSRGHVSKTVEMETPAG